MNDAEWRALAAQNPMRGTYPTWKPKAYWEAKRKADPWKPSDSLDWRRANKRQARIIGVWKGWLGKPIKSLPPSGVSLASGEKIAAENRNWY